MINPLIKEILQANKITDYLAKKGHHPVGSESGGKLKYRCPIHEGDRTPSFMVYLNGNFENYFCYGCKHTYNIIHLYMAMENVTKKVAIRELSKDLNIDFDAHINEAVEYCERNDSIREQFTLEELALAVSRFIYDFIKRVNFEKSLVNKSEKINEIADKAMDDGDIVTLKALYDNLPDRLQFLTREYDSTATA